ncbi:hypothetical protein BJ165DRAFT_1341372, partial [Panaeolus papilionaceus]
DIVIISSDGRAISAHKANLGQFSNGFPPHDGSDTSAETGRGLLERVSLQEKGDVLRLLLQFMHHTLLPDLDEVPFEVLAGLAEAAEKYGVFSAIALSKKCMRSFAKDPQFSAYNAATILFYALKHGYKQIADDAANLTLSVSLESLLHIAQKAETRPEHVIQWVCPNFAYFFPLSVLIQVHLFPDALS